MLLLYKLPPAYCCVGALPSCRYILPRRTTIVADRRYGQSSTHQKVMR